MKKFSSSDKEKEFLTKRVASNADNFRKVNITKVPCLSVQGTLMQGWNFDGGYAGNFVATGRNTSSWKRVYKKVIGEKVVRVFELASGGHVKVTLDLELTVVPTAAKIVSDKATGEILELYWNINGDTNVASASQPQSELTEEIPGIIKEKLSVRGFCGEKTDTVYFWKSAQL